ncbi:TIGR03067 domain-containing protein [bacterium]|nr:TIGR03067 domain-containing protein [bacterium]
MFTRRILFASVLCLAVFAGVQADEAAVKALQGKWGNDGSDGFDATWTFTDNKLEANVNGNVYKAEFKLDSGAKPNATMDITITESPDGQGENKVGKAIYKLEGEKLVLCVSMPGQDRPTEFSTIDEVQYKFELKKK